MDMTTNNTSPIMINKNPILKIENTLLVHNKPVKIYKEESQVFEPTIMIT